MHSKTKGEARCSDWRTLAMLGRRAPRKPLYEFVCYAERKAALLRNTQPGAQRLHDGRLGDTVLAMRV